MVKFVCARRNALPVELIEVYSSQGNRILLFALRRALDEQMNFVKRGIAV